MPLLAAPKAMKRPGGMGEGEGESATHGALATRRGPEAGNRRLEAGGNGAVGGEGDQPFPPGMIEWQR